MTRDMLLNQFPYGRHILFRNKYNDVLKLVKISDGVYKLFALDIYNCWSDVEIRDNLRVGDVLKFLNDKIAHVAPWKIIDPDDSSIEYSLDEPKKKFFAKRFEMLAYAAFNQDGTFDLTGGVEKNLPRIRIYKSDIENNYDDKLCTSTPSGKIAKRVRVLVELIEDE